MKIKGFIFFGIIMLILQLWSCSGSGDGERISALESERDSMLSVIERQDTQLDQITCFFDSISLCIDSITEQEHLLLAIVDPETNRRFSKKEMHARLELLSDIISRQRERIRLLSDSLNTVNPENFASLSNMVIYLSEQLEQKKQKVNQLLAEIDSKNRSIRKLTDDLNTTKNQLDEAVTKNEILSEAVVEQSAVINETYILIGDKDKLKSLGVLSKGGFLKKSEFKPGSVRLSDCQKVDIRQLHELPLNSRKPKILSAVPDNSYHWQNANGMSILVIDNANSFWSLSNILVIQL